MDLFLSTRCPQCGADISFEEESTVIHCEYCGGALHITGRAGVMRTYIAPREDIRSIKKAIRSAVKDVGKKKILVSERRLFFAPYWRIKGMVFRWLFGRDPEGETIKKLKTKQLDHTFPAYGGINLGLRSLGVRPGAVKLLLFDSAGMSKMGSIMNMAVSLKEAANYGTSLTDVGLDETGVRLHLRLTRLIGERYSVIYFPFWMMKLTGEGESRILILDGVANRITRILTQEQWQEVEEKAARQPAKVSFSQVFFIPFKCPNCGWELPMNRFDIIHMCGTCHQAWIEHSGRFRGVRFEVAAPPEGLDRPFVYFPFWVFQAEFTSQGQTLKTVENLQEFSDVLPTTGDQRGDRRPMTFYVPAATIRNIAAANKLATRVTQNQPAFGQMPKDRLSDSKSMGVSLPPKAAADMADILLCSITPRNNRNRQDFVHHAKRSVSKLHLVWWPFYEQRLFLRDAICDCGIQKGTLSDYRTRQSVEHDSA